MFTLFFPKKVAKKDLKIIIFLFDCFTTHNLTHIFLIEMRLQKSGWIAIFEYKFFKSISNVCVVFPQKSGKTGF